MNNVSVTRPYQCAAERRQQMQCRLWEVVLWMAQAPSRECLKTMLCYERSRQYLRHYVPVLQIATVWLPGRGLASFFLSSRLFNITAIMRSKNSHARILLGLPTYLLYCLPQPRVNQLDVSWFWNLRVNFFLEAIRQKLINLFIWESHVFEFFQCC